MIDHISFALFLIANLIMFRRMGRNRLRRLQALNVSPLAREIIEAYYEVEHGPLWKPNPEKRAAHQAEIEKLCSDPELRKDCEKELDRHYGPLPKDGVK